MEIEIDVALVSRITAEEYEQATAEIAAVGPLQAYASSQLRHDVRVAQAPDVTTLACKAGCHWCCYFSVDVRPVEVFRVLDYVATHFSLAEQERVTQEITVNSAIFAPLDEIQRMQRTVKCPFLNAGQCMIYTARPQTCRNYHATAVAGCQKSFEEPSNFDIEPEFAALVYQSGGAHVDAFSKALGDAGYDVAAYELNTAFASALATPQEARQRFDAKEKVFPTIQSIDVPLEFMDE